MPAGERSQTWFPEPVAALRQSWRPDPTWEAVIDLRDQLQRSLEHILTSRGIKPATVRCSHCGHVALERHQRSRCAPYCLLLGDSGSSPRIVSDNSTRSGRGIERCVDSISMVGRGRATLKLSTATVRNGCEPAFPGAVELHVRPDRWLAFGRRGRSTWTFGAQSGTRSALRRPMRSSARY
jgi:hypothetical protein